MAVVDEQVLVVRTSLLSRREASPARGFQQGVDPCWLQSIEREGFFVPRRQAENCGGLKQIILYLVLRHRRSLFVYQRICNTTETRLMNMYSIGLGGHVNPAAGGDGQLFRLNMHRELKEEVQFGGVFSYRMIGTVNDDRSEVGKYHLGLVYLLSCAAPEVGVRETGKLSGSLLPVSQAAVYEPRMETWSALILPWVRRIIEAE